MSKLANDTKSAPIRFKPSGRNASRYDVPGMVLDSAPAAAYEPVFRAPACEAVATCLLSEDQATAAPWRLSVRVTLPSPSNSSVLVGAPAASVFPSGDQAQERKPVFTSPKLLTSLLASTSRIWTARV